MSDPGPLPDYWSWTSVSSIGEVITGSAISTSFSPGTRRVPYLRVANVLDDEVEVSDLKEAFFRSKEVEKYLLKFGDVLLCEGQSLELVGRSAMYRDELPELCFQNTLLRFRAGPEVDPEYALLVFRLYQRNGTFQRIARATTNLAHLGLNRFRNLLFPLAPLETQGSIGELARGIQTQLDYFVAAVEEARAEANEVLGKFRHRAILGDLPVELPLDDLPELSPQWRWARAAEVVTEEAPIVYGIVQPGVDVGSGQGVPYIRGGELRDGFILEDNLRYTSLEIAERHSRSKLRAGDVLVALVRDPRVAIVPPALDGANITQGAARLRPGEHVHSIYLSHWLASPAAQGWLQRHMRGIDMPGLNLRDVRRLPVPIPPLRDQLKIIRLLDPVQMEAANLQGTLDRLKSVASGVELLAMHGLVFGPREVSPDVVVTSGPAEQEIPSKPRAKKAPRLSLQRSLRAPKFSLTLEALLAALGDAGGELSPEVLLQDMKAGEDAIEDYFLILRDAVNHKLVAVDRPDNESVRLRTT